MTTGRGPPTTTKKTMISFPVKYVNGDSAVQIKADGRKTVDSWGPRILFPETIDLKVTDYCDAGCHFCHEGSTVRGKHADPFTLRQMIREFPYGVELAIGGGNPLAWPGLDHFLDWASQNFICNITVNALHARQKPSYERLIRLQQRGWIHGIGISASSYGFGIGCFTVDVGELKNVTGHVIPGLWGEWISSSTVNSLEHEHSMESIRAEMEGRQYKGYLDRYLILGYKFFRRGEKKHPEMILENIESFKRHQVRIYSYLRHLGVIVSFDNLALEQLGIKQLIKPEEWDGLFMGEDGTRSMFIDAVEQTSAVSSTTPIENRVAWTQKHPLTTFREQHESCRE